MSIETVLNENNMASLMDTYHSGDGISVVLCEQDGRDLSLLKDESLDCIITDHPWDSAANRGGNRNFARYDCFEYCGEDFVEKARVLKPGSFMVEILPSENATNFEYLYRVKQMALDAGFEYYAKVPWIKGSFVSNTGRSSKNSQDVMIFSKGRARALRRDVKKSQREGRDCFMSGSAGMLPTDFNVQPVSKKERIHQSEMPVELLERILGFVTLPGEVVLDQFAGSGAVGEAALKCGRSAVLIELASENTEKIRARLSALV